MVLQVGLKSMAIQQTQTFIADPPAEKEAVEIHVRRRAGVASCPDTLRDMAAAVRGDRSSMDFTDDKWHGWQKG